MSVFSALGNPIKEKPPLFPALSIHSNNDSTNLITKKNENKKARRASLMSALLPGLGQVYNKKVWKVPLIYAAAAGLGYLYSVNNYNYSIFHYALIYRSDDDKLNDLNTESLPQLPIDNIINYKKRYQKYRDLCGFAIGVVYLLNIVDAGVDAHLASFNTQINDDLSLSIRPQYKYYALGNTYQSFAGVKIQLSFKKNDKLIHTKCLFKDLL